MENLTNFITLEQFLDILNEVNEEIQNLKKDIDTDKIMKEIISKLKLKGV